MRVAAQVALLAFALAACSDRVTAPTASSTAHPIAASAVTFWEAGASVRWNAIERDLLIRRGLGDPITGFRQFAYLSLAQYNAVIAAEHGEEGATRPSPQAAVAGASAVVLTYFFPSEQAFLDGQVGAQREEEHWAGESQTDFAAGEAIGRAVAAQVVASAATDRFNDPWTGTIPVCPGCWHSNAPGLPPAHPQLGQARPFFLTRGDQFRPVPPPAFGSAEFLAGLAEIRTFSDTRTHEQDSIAKYWVFPVGTFLVPGFWNRTASDLIVRYRQDERTAAHTLALTNMAALDALIASHDAKFFYWLIRPSQADPLIIPDIGVPNFPSYPSNHATVSTTVALILGSIFPSEAGRLSAMADEAGESRLYGGIHYRFDKTAGEALARKVAALAQRLDVTGHEAYALKP
ncbi:MAG TPA: vanadium-dependent haloperoxidase [Gemmatimonadales bacterium]|nr:vanadium-dependent haloperoxidase [Gemmatimonadales bacterium]